MNYSNDYGFDVIDYVKKLRNVGISPAAAEVQGQELSHALKTMGREMKAEIKQELHSDDLATKGDIRESELSLQKEIKELEVKLEIKIANIKNELIQWVLGIGVTASIVVCGAMFTMLKLMLH
ncbi:MAG TPA: hypothetical protein VKR58_09880 [Aquella sp.]|nr:hypothetical protein [Aquella sp.]